MMIKMAATKRKIGIYTTAGIAAAIIIIGAIFASGIQIPLGSNTGTLMVSIKDAPVDLKELWITVESLYIQSVQDDKWIELTLDADQPVTFDLLTLRDSSLQLSQDTISAGNYSKIRIGVTTATATYIDNNGTSHTGEELKIPPGHIDVITNFKVEVGQVTGLLIDMQPNTAAISESGNFKPIIKASITPIPTPTPSPSPNPSPTT